MKGLINIVSIDNKCLVWCHIRYLNPLRRHRERTAKADKNMVNDLDYEGIKFPVSKGDYCKIEQKNVFCYENELTSPVYVSDMDLSMITKENKSHYVYIKEFQIISNN